jgi:hypothetical protein
MDAKQHKKVNVLRKTAIYMFISAPFLPIKAKTYPKKSAFAHPGVISAIRAKVSKY